MKRPVQRRASWCRKTASVFVRIALVLLCVVSVAFADSGILLPRDKSQPDPNVLSLEEMEITVVIDNGDARVYIRQVFANHTSHIEEGTYIFALPSRATVSDFAVWDGPTRIPAVILERKRAGEIYNELEAANDRPWPAADGRARSGGGSAQCGLHARIVPIPAYGTKRFDLEYHESIPVENLKSFFAIPLHPDAGQGQSAARLKITLELKSAHDLSDFQMVGNTYPLKVTEKNAHSVKGEFEGRSVRTGSDFAISYDFNAKVADRLDVITHREPNSERPDPTETAPVRSTNEPGFFEAQALIAARSGSSSAEGSPRTVVLMFDNSLSMQWDKLERSYAAMERILRALRPEDRFNILLFNNRLGVSSHASGGRPSKCSEGVGFRSRQPIARWDEPPAGANHRARPVCRHQKRKCLPAVIDGWRSYARNDPCRSAGNLVRGGMEEAATSESPSHLRICRGRRCQSAAAAHGCHVTMARSNTCSPPSHWISNSMHLSRKSVEAPSPSFTSE